MAIPFYRIGQLSQNAANLLDSLNHEIKAGPSYQRRIEIEEEVRLITIITKAMLKPHAEYLKSVMDTKILEEFGLI